MHIIRTGFNHLSTHSFIPQLIIEQLTATFVTLLWTLREVRYPLGNTDIENLITFFYNKYNPKVKRCNCKKKEGKEEKRDRGSKCGQSRHKQGDFFTAVLDGMVC